jgi:hypothetical protein
MILHTTGRDLDAAIASHIKNSNSAVIKHKTSWTTEDLELAGVPQKHQESTLKMLQTAARNIHYGWLDDEAPQRTAY